MTGMEIAARTLSGGSSILMMSSNDTLVSSYKTESADNEFAADDNDHDPGGKLSQLYQTDQRGADQKLVRQRIHEFSEIRDEIVFPGDLSVQEIREAGDEEQHKGYHPECEDLTIMDQQRRHKKRHQYHAKHSQFVRQCPNHIISPFRSYSDASVTRTFTKVPDISSYGAVKNRYPSTSGASIQVLPI